MDNAAATAIEEKTEKVQTEEEKAELKEKAEKEALHTKYDKFIPHLLTEPTIEAACKAGGISPATYYRWLLDRDFVDKCRDSRYRFLEATNIKLQTLSGEAVEALKKNLTCGNPSVEVRAALGILTQTTKGIEINDLLDKLERIKEMLEVDKREREEGE